MKHFQKVSLAAVLVATLAGGCAKVWHNMTSNDKWGNYRLYSIRIPTAQQGCIDRTEAVWDRCAERTEATQGEMNIDTCNGEMMRAATSCPGATENLMKELVYAKQSEVTATSCRASLPSADPVYCISWHADSDGTFAGFGWTGVHAASDKQVAASE